MTEKLAERPPYNLEERLDVLRLVMQNNILVKIMVSAKEIAIISAEVPAYSIPEQSEEEGLRLRTSVLSAEDHSLLKKEVEQPASKIDYTG